MLTDGSVPGRGTTPLILHRSRSLPDLAGLITQARGAWRGVFREGRAVKRASMFTPGDLACPEGGGKTFRKYNGTVLRSTGGKQSWSTRFLLLVARLRAVVLRLH